MCVHTYIRVRARTYRASLSGGKGGRKGRHKGHQICIELCTYGKGHGTRDGARVRRGGVRSPCSVTADCTALHVDVDGGSRSFLRVVDRHIKGMELVAGSSSWLAREQQPPFTVWFAVIIGAVCRLLDDKDVATFVSTVRVITSTDMHVVESSKGLDLQWLWQYTNAFFHQSWR